jgi:hypothetical protein
LTKNRCELPDGVSRTLTENEQEHDFWLRLCRDTSDAG